MRLKKSASAQLRMEMSRGGSKTITVSRAAGLQPMQTAHVQASSHNSTGEL
jgi:hypothetical protein